MGPKDERGSAVVVSPKRDESTRGGDEGPEMMIVGIGPGMELTVDGLLPMSVSAQGTTVPCGSLPSRGCDRVVAILCLYGCKCERKDSRK